MKSSSKRITINDVAAKAGVSKSTVSLVIRQSPLVKPATRELVESAMREIGYVYDRDAANLRSRSSNVVGLIIHDLTNPFFAEMYVGLEKALTEAGYVTLVSNTSDDPEAQLRNFNAMKEHRTAGFIICPALGTDDDFVNMLAQQDAPIVSVIRPLPGQTASRFDHVAADVERGAYLATAHLLDQGYCNVAYVGGRDTPIMELRLKGFRAALEEKGLSFDESLVYRCKPTRGNGERAARDLLGSGGAQKIDGFVCYNDLVAFGALWGLHDLGIPVGKDFGVIGFDNVAATSYATPPLSSISADSSSIGKAAAHQLLVRIREQSAIGQNIVKDVRLVVRKSSLKTE